MTKADKREIIALLTKAINDAGEIVWEVHRDITERFPAGPHDPSSAIVTINLELSPPKPKAQRRKLAHA